MFTSFFVLSLSVSVTSSVRRIGFEPPPFYPVFIYLWIFANKYCGLYVDYKLDYFTCLNDWEFEWKLTSIPWKLIDFKIRNKIVSCFISLMIESDVVFFVNCDFYLFWLTPKYAEAHWRELVVTECRDINSVTEYVFELVCTMYCLDM